MDAFRAESSSANRTSVRKMIRIADGAGLPKPPAGSSRLRLRCWRCATRPRNSCPGMLLSAAISRWRCFTIACVPAAVGIAAIHACTAWMAMRWCCRRAGRCWRCREAPEKPGRALSLAWLQKEFAKIESAASLAVARMTLENYGIEPPHAKPRPAGLDRARACRAGNSCAGLGLPGARSRAPLGARCRNHKKRRSRKNANEPAQSRTHSILLAARRRG